MREENSSRCLWFIDVASLPDQLEAWADQIEQDACKSDTCYEAAHAPFFKIWAASVRMQSSYLRAVLRPLG